MKRDVWKWVTSGFALFFALAITAVGYAQETTPPADATAECAKDAKDTDARGDERCDFEVSFYVGRVIDSFAAAELNHYINPDESSKTRESYIGGVDFAYRFRRAPAGDDRGHDWWVYGETIHGIRSTDVDCQADKTIAVCKQNPPEGDRFLFILRNARSLESYAGVRYEIPLTNPRTKETSSGRFFVASQLGFLTVAGAGGDVVDSHTWLSAGLMTVSGRFSRSYVQAGVGKTDLFHEHHNSRFKVDGFLSMQFTSRDIVRPFLQMTVDSDGRGGADSIQSYFGIDVNFTSVIRDLFK